MIRDMGGRIVPYNDPRVIRKRTRQADIGPGPYARPMSVEESEAKRADACLHCRMAEAKLGQARVLIRSLARALRDAAPDHPYPEQVAAYLEANNA